MQISNAFMEYILNICHRWEFDPLTADGNTLQINSPSGLAELYITAEGEDLVAVKSVNILDGTRNHNRVTFYRWQLTDAEKQTVSWSVENDTVWIACNQDSFFGGAETPVILEDGKPARFHREDQRVLAKYVNQTWFTYMQASGWHNMENATLHR